MSSLGNGYARLNLGEYLSEESDGSVYGDEGEGSFLDSESEEDGDAASIPLPDSPTLSVFDMLELCDTQVDVARSDELVRPRIFEGMRSDRNR
jgi:hypothetical protein